jgi:hypothetical protein
VEERRDPTIQVLLEDKLPEQELFPLLLVELLVLVLVVVRVQVVCFHSTQ